MHQILHFLICMKNDSTLFGGDRGFSTHVEGRALTTHSRNGVGEQGPFTCRTGVNR